MTYLVPVCCAIRCAFGYLKWEGMRLTNTEILFSTTSCFMHETLWVVFEWEHQTRQRDYWWNKRDICNHSNRWESHQSLISLLYLDLRQSWLTFLGVLAPSQSKLLVHSLRMALALCARQCHFLWSLSRRFWELTHSFQNQ